MTDVTSSFEELGLPSKILKAVTKLGYEQPSAIQEKSIPVLLEGRDLLGQAQTGTGKTAAFALPILSKVDVKSKDTQCLILAPTRELAIQVAEACQQYSQFLGKLSVVPIYGGQSYSIQLKQLSRGAQVVVGTPGRVMDHMRRGTLDLSNLRSLVLDEADEMLRMGFIEDVEWVLERSPDDKQIALFSATMPKQVQRVADSHLKNPSHIKIANKTATAASIQQRYWIAKGMHKLDAITRILESEETDGVIVFVRTKNATVELADKLSARGFRSEALNGDIPQANREKVVDRLRKNRLDILVATDVVARGLDVERISHVVNYDVPHDTESYIHRIGRTGRAGREGKAILFVAPREKRMLYAIERATKQPIEPLDLPSVSDINAGRVAKFKQKLLDVVRDEDLSLFSNIIAELQMDSEISSEQIAAASAFLAQGGSELLLSEKSQHGSDSVKRAGAGESTPPEKEANKLKEHPDVEMARFLIHVGHNHRVKPGSIVGCIANEADLDSVYIGDIIIRDSYSTVDLPADMPKEVKGILRKARVANRALMIEAYKGAPGKPKEESKSRTKPDRKPKKSYNSKAKKGSKGKGKISDYAKKKRKDRKK